MSGAGRVQGVSDPAEPAAAKDSHRTSGTGNGRARGQRAPRRVGQIPGGRHGLAPEAVAESQRTRLLAAMAEAVRGQGYAATSISDVIARAGVSRKTFYEQFDGKDDCFAVAYALEMDRLREAAVAAHDAEDPPWSRRLRAGLTALCGALAANPGAARLCFVEAFEAGPVTTARRREALRALEPLFADAPADALAAAELGGSLRMGRIADLAEMLRNEIEAGAGGELPRLVPELTYLLALPFLGPERAARELGGPPATLRAAS